MNYITRFTCFVLIASLVASCAPRNPGSSNLEPNELVDDSNPFARLVLGDESLANQVNLTNPKIRDQGSFKQGSVTVQNLSDENYNLEYRFVWRDGDGFETSSRSWSQINLSPQDVRQFQSTAQDPEANQYTFTVRLTR